MFQVFLVHARSHPFSCPMDKVELFVKRIISAIFSETWMFVCCEGCVLSRRGVCDRVIIRSEESYRLWRVAVCDQVTSYSRRLKPDRGL